ncbi:hypothetical protein GCM10009559_09780 [Pseudonocardia zijingensis]|uniref:PH (Pleckstrin Homology) domain-containing protein n=2 Tax=Pseudonocardia zijingensis TaxID=153376 RepID=A0ABN1PA45_9PSEU
MASFDRSAGETRGRETGQSLDARARVRSRLRRTRLWLTWAQVVHGGSFVFVVLALVDGAVPPVGAMAAGALLVAPLVAFALQERRAPSRRRPAIWPRRGLLVVLPHAAVFGIVVAVRSEPASPPWGQALLFAGLLLVVEFGAIWRASRVLRFPLTPELGEMDVEILVEIRSDAAWQPAWLSQHDVRMTDDALIITVRPTPKFGYAARIDLADVTGVLVRPAADREGPWFVVDGYTFWPPAGDVVVIRHGSGSTVLPVHEPEAFAAVVRSRTRF